MTNRPNMLLAVLVVIGGFCLYLNKDWFQRRPIQISHRLYRFGSRFSNEDAPIPVMFEFDRKLKLTSIQVVALSDILTNKYPHALWRLVSDSNSLPTKGFVYGLDVPGMRPAVKGLNPEALLPSQPYRVLVEAGSLKAQHDFTLEPSTQ